MNENSDDSRAIGSHYAEKRRLPATHICRLHTTDAETIPRDAYEREILRPTADFLKSGNLQDQILYVLTTRGLPLVVEGVAGQAGGLTSVDGELTLLYRYMVRGSTGTPGRIENPYFSVEFHKEGFRPFVRSNYDIYLVTRLTGASAPDAALLVDRAISSAPGGGFYFDLASAQQSNEAAWVRQAAAVLRGQGFAVTVESTGKVLDNLANVQGYANQEFTDLNLGSGIPHFQWSPGALALVLGRGRGISHGSGETKGLAGISCMISRYVESGVTGFGGHVADPGMDGFIRPQILFPAYAAGYNLAEAFFAASRYIGWRQIVVGDPLAMAYQGYATNRHELAAKFHPGVDSETGLPEHFSMRRLGVLSQKYSTSREALVLLLKGEASAARRDTAAALDLVERSLEQDPYVVESHLLKADLLEREGDFSAAFAGYKKAFELGATGRDQYWKLARLALDGLGDPAKAAPYVSWLYQNYGRFNLEAAALYVDVELRSGRSDEAQAALRQIAADADQAPIFALGTLGRIYHQKGDSGLARNYLARALRQLHEKPDRFPLPKDSALLVNEAEIQRLLDSSTPAAVPPKESPAASVAPAATEVASATAHPARILSQTPVEYPRQAQAERLQGLVVVNLLLDEWGQVMKGELVHGHRVLGEAVIEAARRWRFEPALENGRAVESRYALSVDFKINRSDSAQGEIGGRHP